MLSKTDFTHENCSCLTAASAAAEHMETKIMHRVLPSEKKKLKKRRKTTEIVFLNTWQPAEICLKIKVELGNKKSVNLITGHSTIPSGSQTSEKQQLLSHQ